MKKGIIKVIIFYFVGVIATTLSYMLFDHSYAHGPSLYHAIALLTFFVGVFWTAGAILKFFFKETSEERKGIILTNLIVLVGTYLVFYLTVIRPEETGSASDISEEKMTTSVNGDTTTVDINGRIVSIKVKDSVYLDSTASIK